MAFDFRYDTKNDENYNRLSDLINKINKNYHKQNSNLSESQSINNNINNKFEKIKVNLQKI